MEKPMQCKPVTRDLFKNVVDISVPQGLDLKRAKAIADARAHEIAPDPMLLAWYDRRAGKFSPHVDFCEFDNRPVWLVFAESRGGNITIDINNEEFIFIYADFS